MSKSLENPGTKYSESSSHLELGKLNLMPALREVFLLLLTDQSEEGQDMY
jgi:hypothetical protein